VNIGRRAQISATHFPHCELLLEKLEAGFPSVEQAFGRHVHWGYLAGPLKQAIDLVGYFVGSDAEHDGYVNLLSIRTNAFVALPHIWAPIGAVARRLIPQRRMGRTEIRNTIRTALAAPTGPA
jgi:hypothetical protein